MPVSQENFSSRQLLPPIDELKKRRIKLGLSQRKFASYLGVSQSTITKIENKKLSPSYELVKKAFDILDSFGSPQIGLAGDKIGRAHV